MTQSSTQQHNQTQLAREVETIVLQARRVAPKDATVATLMPHVEKIMTDMSVDDSLAAHVRRELTAKGVTLGR